MKESLTQIKILKQEEKHHREQIYDTRDVDATTEKIRDIGNKIQVQIGLDYQITLPKMQQLEVSEMITMMMQVMMVFISILSIYNTIDGPGKVLWEVQGANYRGQM